MTTHDSAATPRYSRRLFGKRALAAVGAATFAVGGASATPAQNMTSLPMSNPAQTTAATTGSTGQAIADFAVQFVGYPYVWAGNTPSGFDCSGFTQYVVLNTVGIDIGHSTEGQMAYGSSVGWGEWAPGDLIYFAGTYKAGISHAAVYIGGGQIVHAGSESTGVLISDLYSDYYASHYYGAIRVA